MRYIDAWTEAQSNIDVYNNLVYDSEGQGIVVASEGGGVLDHVNIYNNIVYNAGYGGGGMGVAPWTTTSSPTHPVHNVNFINNTIYNCLGGGIFINNPEVENILIRNNIFYQSGEALRIDPIVPVSEIISDHNLTSDPQFVNVSMANFRLQVTSPAIDAGSAIKAPGFDFDGNSRPAGFGYDIGAFEYESISGQLNILLPLIFR